MNNTLNVPASLLLPHADESPPVLSTALLQSSAALSSLAYTLDLDPWLEAGWCDITVQYEDDLTVGVEAPKPTAGLLHKLGEFAAKLKLNRLQEKLKPRPALLQLPQGVRELHKTHSGKAVILLKPLEDGRFVVAIGFSGTGKKLYDWIPNLRTAAVNNLHEGFLQVTEQFEANADRICFPQAAASLGLKQLTLADVLDECTRPGSRFLLWISGHSQGSAVMQLWTLRRMQNDGVLGRYLTGCGFASPAPVAAAYPHAPDAYPLLHLINSEDVVGRCGCGVQLGLVLRYDADYALHTACYRSEHSTATLLAANVAAHMRTVTDTLLMLAAMVCLLQSLPQEELNRLLAEKLPWLNRISGLMSGRTDPIFRSLMRHLNRDYQSMTGRPLPMHRVDRHVKHLQQAASFVGLMPLISALAARLFEAHSLKPTGSYSFIVRQDRALLHPMRWLGGSCPG